MVPGRIMEEDLKIMNRSSESIVLKVICLCENDEFADHDEYVYSVRKANNYDYNEKYFILLTPNSSIHLKVALKVPNFYKRIELRGNLAISVKNVEGIVDVPITSFNHVPKITCEKELFSHSYGFNVIRLAHKKGKKQEFKIPFKNTSPRPLTVELEFHKDPDTKKSFLQPLEFTCHPNFTIIPPRQQGLIKVLIQPSDTYGF